MDRRVKDAFLRMTGSPDKGLVRLLRKRVPRLTPQQIAQSLHRLVIRVELPTIAPPGGLKPQTKRAASRKAAAQKDRKTRGTSAQVSLADVVAAGVFRAPLRLYRKYKGSLVEARVQADGKVEFQGSVYDSCSTAAEMARRTVTGRRMKTNGWSFWQYDDADGQKRKLDDARQEFLQRKRKS